MEIPAQTLEMLIVSVTEYSETSLELIKLKAIDKTAGTVSAVVPHLFIGILMSFVFLFFSLGLALWLGHLLGQLYYGFFAVAGMYIVLAGVSYLFLLEWCKRLVCNFIIRNIMINA